MGIGKISRTIQHVLMTLTIIGGAACRHGLPVDVTVKVTDPSLNGRLVHIEGYPTPQNFSTYYERGGDESPLFICDMPNGNDCLWIKLPRGNGNNCAEELPDKYTKEDVRVHDQTGQLIRWSDRMELIGVLHAENFTTDPNKYTFWIEGDVKIRKLPSNPNP